MIKRNDDLTEAKFQKRVNKKISKESIEYRNLSKRDIDELLDA